MEQTKVYLDLYATHGLRTLLFLKREITEEEYQQWTIVYKNANVQQGKLRDEQLEEAFKFLE